MHSSWNRIISWVKEMETLIGTSTVPITITIAIPPVNQAEALRSI
jgi:hypothetical protein